MRKFVTHFFRDSQDDMFPPRKWEIMLKVEERKNRDYYDDSLMPVILRLLCEAKKAEYKQKFTVMPEDKKTALYVDKSSTYMKKLVTLASATGDPVELITKEGTVFKCFVEPDGEDTDKIVRHKFDDAWLEMLFKGRKAKGEKAEEADIAQAEAAVMEMLNGMKHMTGDIENKKKKQFDRRFAVDHIFDRWDEHPLLDPMLHAAAREEEAWWMEGKKTDLLTCELKESLENGNYDEARAVVSDIVEICEGLPAETVEKILFLLMALKVKYGHAVDELINRLEEILKKKTTPQTTTQVNVGLGGANIQNVEHYH